MRRRGKREQETERNRRSEEWEEGRRLWFNWQLSSGQAGRAGPSRAEPRRGVVAVVAVRRRRDAARERPV
jgi:hypothetical protein